MPRKQREAGASPSATGTIDVTFAQIIESVGQRSRALVERAAHAGLRAVAAAIRRRGRQVVDALRDLADTERHLNAVQSHAAALAELGRDGPATPSPVASSAGTRRPALRRVSSLEVQLRFVRARAKGAEALEAEKQAIHRETGLAMPRISALLARTNGKNKAGFAAKALQSVTGDERTRLAAELEGHGYGQTKKLLASARG